MTTKQDYKHPAHLWQAVARVKRDVERTHSNGIFGLPAGGIPFTTEVAEERWCLDTTCGVCHEVVSTQEFAGMAVVPLPVPGELADYHAETEKVWYFGQSGEFTFDSYNNSLHDHEGNTWGADELREMAAAALACAAEVERRQRA